ncbi:MBL fold metallo-hydrolase [Sporosalibacterium faouarense]|uniref:MBL fold metallo-hydrolase n=1 Tax=Sporosalibacterium faouarense TaxID=516123 RepID=UPI00192C59F1
MSTRKAKITHLFHSSFLVETENHTLIFDYFDYTCHHIINSSKILTSDFFNNRKNVYVFVSHSHKDHFDPEIFQWKESNPDIRYILSNDVELNEQISDTYFVSKNEETKIDSLKINTYGSTDLGVSFLIEVDGLIIFHSGDLNWWHWQNDSKETQSKEEKDFKSEVDKLIGKKIDMAFVPADPRLQEFYYLACKYFIETIKPKVLFPMHFSDKFNIPKKLSKKLQHLDTNIAVITEKNKEFLYKK